MAEGELILRPLATGDSFRSISCGDVKFQALKTFANSKAQPYERESLARTYVVETAQNKLIAYVTLVCSEVRSSPPLLGADQPMFPYDHYPAVKIARLLVDSRHRTGGLRLGSQLVEFALGVAKAQICPAVGCRFAVVDAMQDSVPFYERCGFTAVNTPENLARSEPVMFIDLHRAA